MRFLILLLLAFVFPLSAAPKDQVANGNLTYGQEVFNSLQINGFVNLNGTTILQRLQVNGNLTASNAQIGELQTNGQASLAHCTVKGKCNVTGSLKGFDTIFEQPIVLTTVNSVFDSCTVVSIQVLKNNDNVTQTIEIKGKTNINGLISFESGNGQVVVCRECKINESNIVGGKLVRR